MVSPCNKYISVGDEALLDLDAWLLDMVTPVSIWIHPNTHEIHESCQLARIVAKKRQKKYV